MFFWLTQLFNQLLLSNSSIWIKSLSNKFFLKIVERSREHKVCCTSYNYNIFDGRIGDLKFSKARWKLFSFWQPHVSRVILSSDINIQYLYRLYQYHIFYARVQCALGCKNLQSIWHQRQAASSKTFLKVIIVRSFVRSSSTHFQIRVCPTSLMDDGVGEFFKLKTHLPHLLLLLF